MKRGSSNNGRAEKAKELLKSKEGESEDDDDDVDLFSVPMNSEAFLAKIAQ